MSKNLKTIMAIVVSATTLALGSMSHAASPHQEAAPRPESLRFSPIELQPDTPMVLICGRTTRHSNIAGLREYAKGNPGRVNFGNAESGTGDGNRAPRRRRRRSGGGGRPAAS